MWRNTLLSKPVAVNQSCVAEACEYQAVIGSKQERHGHTPQRTKPSDQRMLQRTAGSHGLAAARQMPANSSRGVAIYHQGQRAQLSRPAQIRHRSVGFHDCEHWYMRRLFISVFKTKGVTVPAIMINMEQ